MKVRSCGQLKDASLTFEKQISEDVHYLGLSRHYVLKVVDLLFILKSLANGFLFGQDHLLAATAFPPKGFAKLNFCH